MKTHLFFSRKKKSPLFCLMVGISLIILLSGLGYSQEIIKKTPEQLSNSLVFENQFLDNKSIIDSLFMNYQWDNGGYPPTWKPDSVIITNWIHAIQISVEHPPLINGEPIVPGDYIGGFYIGDDGDFYCGGCMAWNGTGNLLFPLFGDDYYTPEKDGFDYGEWINWKIYSWQYHKTYDVDEITFYPGSLTINKWYNLGMSMITYMNCIVEFDVLAEANPNSLCAGDPCQLSANIHIGSGGPYTFSWTSDPPGFTSNLQNPEVYPTITTTYFIKAREGIYISEHQVTVEVVEPPEVSAGPEQTICDDEPVFLNGSAENYSSVLWTTGGDGVFDDSNALSTFYTPGPVDKINGLVELGLTAYPIEPCVNFSQDFIEITLRGCQYFELPSGWSGISAYVNPLDANIENIFEPIVEDLIILQNFFGLYYPEQNINTLENWDTHSGYFIKVNENVELTIVGTRDVNKTISLPQGWSLIPVISDCPVNVEQLFAGIEDKLVIIKEAVGLQLYWPEKGINSLISVLPGNSYLVFMNEPAEITFPGF